MADPVATQYGYVSSDEIVKFMQGVNPLFTVLDINPIIANASYRIVSSKMDENFNMIAPSADSTVLLDGTGYNFVYSELIPILSITSIKVINQDGSKFTFTTTGTDRNVWWDDKTGRIWLGDLSFAEIAGDGSLLMFDEDDPRLFPNWPDSIEVIGKFGSLATDLIKLIQLLTLLKNYAVTSPASYHPDAIEERIGKYTYKLPESAKNAGRLGLDQHIDKLMSLAFTNSVLGMESI